MRTHYEYLFIILLGNIVPISLQKDDDLLTITMEGYCPGTFTISPDAQVRIWTSYDVLYPPNMNCATTIQTSQWTSSQVMLYFKHFHLEGSHNCLADWLTIHDGPDTTYPVLGNQRYCGMKTPNTVFTSSGDTLTLFFHSSSSTGYKGIEAIATEFHTGSCESTEVSCDNGRCIDEAISCSGYDPCGDQSDCGQLSDGAIIGIVIGCVIVGSVLFALCLSAIRRWRIRQILKKHTIHHVVIASIGTTRRTEPEQPPPYTGPDLHTWFSR